AWTSSEDNRSTASEYIVIVALRDGKRKAIVLNRSKGATRRNESFAIGPLENILRLRFSTRRGVGQRHDQWRVTTSMHRLDHIFSEDARLATHTQQNGRPDLLDHLKQILSIPTFYTAGGMGQTNL